MRAAMGRASRELLRDADVQVEAVVVTAQMFSLQPVDGAMEPVGPMLSWLDQRAAPQAAALAGTGDISRERVRCRNVTGWRSPTDQSGKWRQNVTSPTAGSVGVERWWRGD